MQNSRNSRNTVSALALAGLCFLAVGCTDSSSSSTASSSDEIASSSSSSDESPSPPSPTIESPPVETPVEESSSDKDESSSSSDFATSADKAAMADLETNAWVKDLYVSPGNMNIGVIRGEKEWDAPMINTYACAVLKKHGSKLRNVRFVDIEAVTNQGQSPRQAEIYSSSCR